MQPELIRFQRDFARALDCPAEGAMAVYRNTVIHGAVEALRANYPVVEQILGEEMFQHVAVDFASTYPPRDPVLALYGAEFADWLMQQDWTAHLPYLPDVARVERLHVSSLLAADQERLSPEHAAQLSRLPSTSLRLHPAAHFAWLATPAMSIWLAHQEAAVSEMAPEWRGEGALFARPKPLISHAALIGRTAHRLLSGVRLGEALGVSMAAAAKLYPQEDCAAVLASLVTLGVFIAPARERN